MDYSTLIADKDTDGSIRQWVNYGLAPATAILADAEAWIYERLRVREMRVEATVSIAAGDDEIALPARFLDPIDLLLDGDAEPLEYKHESLLRRLRDSDGNLYSGAVSAYTIVGEAMKFDVESDAARTGVLWFYQSPAPLAADNETNFVTTRYPRLLRVVTSAFVNEFRKLYGERDNMLREAMSEIETVNILAERSRRGQTMR